MAVYHVIIDQGANVERVMERLRKNYTDHYEYHGAEALIFLRTDDIAEKIAENLGINGPKEDGAGGEDAGVVFKMNADYSGFTNRGIWQWLAKHD